MSFSVITNYVYPFGNNEHNRYESEIGDYWTAKHKLITSLELWCIVIEEFTRCEVEAFSQDKLQSFKNFIDLIKNNESKLEELYNLTNEYEKETKHDIYALIKAVNKMCPEIETTLHNGLTSNYINDNYKYCATKSSFMIIKTSIAKLIQTLNDLAKKHADFITFSYTHMQQAMLITYGYRFKGYSSILTELFNNFNWSTNFNVIRGATGTVGTSDTLMKILQKSKLASGHSQPNLNKATKKMCYTVKANIKHKIRNLNLPYVVTEKIDNYTDCVFGQTTPRSYDIVWVSALKAILIEISKICSDFRFFASLGEVHQVVSKTQVGSSAMPHKNNPITFENINGIVNTAVADATVIDLTAMTQIAERTLNDSSAHRITLPPFLMKCNVCINKLNDALQNIEFDKEAINKNIQDNIVTIVSEVIIIHGTNILELPRDDIHEELKNITRNKKHVTKEDFEKSEMIKGILDSSNISFDPKDYIGLSAEKAHDTFLGNMIFY